ncbi:MAG TPA: 1,4-dihydroxy-2-naphthoate octaprenyltransferase [Chthoniobacterales bacterium]|jgi:1,4-dihydroxy-2-naphthoate octaprenyltransferase
MLLSKNGVPTSTSFLASLKSFFLACRPKTLSAAVVPVVVGVAVAHFLGFEVDFLVAFYALFSALLIQIGTNLFNDALDFEKGADTHLRLGPRRATHMGWFSPSQIKTAASWCFILAAIVALPLILRGGWPIVAIGSVSLLLGYLYTGGPHPLAYSGLGDFFVIVFFGVVAVMGTAYLQTHKWLVEAFVAGIQVGALATVLIAINNFRDMDTDRTVGKMTLPARFGAWFARCEIALMFALAFGLVFYWTNRPTIFLLLFLPSLVLAVGVVRRACLLQPSEHMNKLLHLAAITQMTFGLAFTGLLVWGGRTL